MKEETRYEEPPFPPLARCPVFLYLGT